MLQSKILPLNRLQDHNVDHSKDNENWELYRKNVVDFLLDRCGLANLHDTDEGPIL
jgi:hypothetical protein